MKDYPAGPPDSAVAAPPPLAMSRLLLMWIEEDATDDPAKIQAANQEIAEFKRVMNESRATSGARLLFP